MQNIYHGCVPRDVLHKTLHNSFFFFWGGVPQCTVMSLACPRSVLKSTRCRKCWFALCWNTFHLQWTLTVTIKQAYFKPCIQCHYCLLFGQKCDHQHLLGEKNPHSVLTMPDFINAREAQRQTGFIQMDYEVQGNSFIGTKTKQRALFLLILEKNSHSLCWVTRRTSLASRSWSWLRKNCNDFLKKMMTRIGPCPSASWELKEHGPEGDPEDRGGACI